jgi:sugar lactone lactonase YvrE
LAISLTVGAFGLSVVQTVTPLERQSFLLERVGYGLALAGILAGLLWIRRRRPAALVGPGLTIAGLIAATFMYIHTSWQLSYAHGDIPVEMLVYVQTSPDVPQTVNEIERIAFQTGQGKDLRILMDNGYTETVGGQRVVHEAISWPYEWYLRDYKNRRYYSRTFGGDINLADYPVALIMGPNLDPVRDRLGDYNGQKYRLNWWYPEDYKGLNWSVIWNGLRDPETRAKLVQYLLYRETLNPLGAREYYFFVRKEIPPLGPSPGSLRSQPAPAPAQSAPRIGTVTVRPEGGAILARSPEGAPLLVQPKGAAVGPDGRLYVVEAGAHRLTVFNPDGSIASSWGRQGNGDGEFQEPWGVAVAPNGEVFVADTWNHRIQKFSSDGRFLKKWGSLADTKGAMEPNPGQFWGPRDIAIGPNGMLYITDAGNKRIQVFDADGNHQRSFGGEGTEPGRLREPVGLAFSGNTLLVADTWNGRIQSFDLQGQTLAQYPVSVWPGQSVTNKPYLAVDANGQIVLSAPDQGTISVLDRNGQPLASLPLSVQGATNGSLPTGLAMAPNGEIHVVDSRLGLVYRLPVPR